MMNDLYVMNVKTLGLIKDLRNYFWKGFNATSLFMNKVMIKNKHISLAYILAMHLKSLICKMK